MYSTFIQDRPCHSSVCGMVLIRKSKVSLTMNYRSLHIMLVSNMFLQFKLRDNRDGVSKDTTIAPWMSLDHWATMPPYECLGVLEQKRFPDQCQTEFLTCRRYSVFLMAWYLVLCHKTQILTSVPMQGHKCRN